MRDDEAFILFRVVIEVFPLRFYGSYLCPTELSYLLYGYFTAAQYLVPTIEVRKLFFGKFFLFYVPLVEEFYKNRVHIDKAGLRWKSRSVYEVRIFSSD